MQRRISCSFQYAKENKVSIFGLSEKLCSDGGNTISKGMQTRRQNIWKKWKIDTYQRVIAMIVIWHTGRRITKRNVSPTRVIGRWVNLDTEPDRGPPSKVGLEQNHCENREPQQILCTHRRQQVRNSRFLRKIRRQRISDRYENRLHETYPLQAQRIEGRCKKELQWMPCNLWTNWNVERPMTSQQHISQDLG